MVHAITCSHFTYCRTVIPLFRGTSGLLSYDPLLLPRLRTTSAHNSDTSKVIMWCAFLCLRLISSTAHHSFVFWMFFPDIRSQAAPFSPTSPPPTHAAISAAPVQSIEGLIMHRHECISPVEYTRGICQPSGYLYYFDPMFVISMTPRILRCTPPSSPSLRRCPEFVNPPPSPNPTRYLHDCSRRRTRPSKFSSTPSTCSTSATRAATVTIPITRTDTTYWYCHND